MATAQWGPGKTGAGVVVPSVALPSKFMAAHPELVPPLEPGMLAPYDPSVQHWMEDHDPVDVLWQEQAQQGNWGPEQKEPGA